jgi:hypothetical protein
VEFNRSSSGGGGEEDGGSSSSGKRVGQELVRSSMSSRAKQLIDFNHIPLRFQTLNPYLAQHLKDSDPSNGFMSVF